MVNITKKAKISDIIEKHPELIRVLIEDYGLHCIGCQMAAFETLEQGATVHGMTKKEVEEMVKKLNSLLKNIKNRNA